MRVSYMFRVLALGITLPSAIIANSATAAEMYRTMAFSLTPITMAREGVVRAEFNLGTRASLALEGIAIGEGEDLFDDEIKESNGDSLITRGGELALFVARYSNSASMSGFYWAMGAGYRQLKANWKRSPGANYSLQGDAYTIVAPDEAGKLNSQMTANGVTGHVRAGYRYLGESVPLSIGAYLGLRHFQSKFIDAKDSDNYVAAPSTNEERDMLRNRYMTKLEPGIEVGFAF